MPLKGLLDETETGEGLLLLLLLLTYLLTYLLHGAESFLSS